MQTADRWPGCWSNALECGGPVPLWAVVNCHGLSELTSSTTRTKPPQAKPAPGHSIPRSSPDAPMQKLWHLFLKHRCMQNLLHDSLTLDRFHTRAFASFLAPDTKALASSGVGYKNSCMFGALECYAKNLACNFCELRLLSPRFRFQQFFKFQKGRLLFLPRQVTNKRASAGNHGQSGWNYWSPSRRTLSAPFSGIPMKSAGLAGANPKQGKFQGRPDNLAFTLTPGSKYHGRTIPI
jgi:hypothetical protein